MPPRRTPRPNDGLTRDRLSRRQFLTRASLLAAGGPAFLAACTRQPEGSASVNGAEPLRLASPKNPIRWPINEGNEPIADNAPVEKGATLQVYTYADYWSEDEVKPAFEQQYGCKVNVTTFGDLDEALTKIRQGTVPFDVWIGSGYDLTSRLVSTSLIRPLNQNLIPNMKHIWPYFQNPWYDQGWQYTVPYTVYTSGLGWRTDMMKSDPSTLPNPWTTLWDPRYRGNTAVWDDYRSTIEMALLSVGITDVNTAEAADLDRASAQLTALTRTTKPTVTIQMYEDMPAKKYGQATLWSGDAINAAWASEGDANKYRYWYAKDDGVGMVDNDLLLVLKGGQNPVLAHKFLDWMLAPWSADKNFLYAGYQMPQREFAIDKYTSDGTLPPELRSVFLKEENMGKGLPALELTTDNQAAWHSVWLAFKAGN